MSAASEAHVVEKETFGTVDVMSVYPLWYQSFPSFKLLVSKFPW